MLVKLSILEQPIHPAAKQQRASVALQAAFEAGAAQRSYNQIPGVFGPLVEIIGREAYGAVAERGAAGGVQPQAGLLG